jgi:hypothetical protein
MVSSVATIVRPSSNGLLGSDSGPLSFSPVMSVVLYSGAIVDTSGGAAVTLPQVPDGRYMSILLVDNDHYRSCSRPWWGAA